MTVQERQIYNLPPQPTPFVGRNPEIKEIVNRLTDQNCRLLTLVGPGGIGKTRLAIESTHQFTKSDFEHGIYYVPLAPLISAENIVTTIINVLGIHSGDQEKPEETLVNFLTQRNLLLVMDNFEHVLTGIAIVTEILNRAPRVKILVTSRETLNLSAEHIWHVEGMYYPDIEEPDDINQYDALNLFIERALQVHRNFSPSDEQLEIIRICQLVDGLPLAIELAVSWLKTLSCQDIIKQLERGIDFLTSRHRDIHERHRSIRAVFDHSWNLLTPDEQAVYPYLAVFRGGFTLQAAEQVAGADLITLSGLVEKSMIRRDASDRYDIHELLRQYGEEYLVVHDDLDKANEVHLSYFANFMSDRVPDLQGRRQIESLNEVRADFDNIRVAFQYASQESNYTKLDEMLECIAIYFYIIGHPPLANEMYAFAIAHLDDSPEREHVRIKNRLKVFSYYAYFKQSSERNSEQIMDDIQPCLKVAEQYDDKMVTLMCLMIIVFNPHNSQPDSDMQRALKLGESMSQYYLSWTLHHTCRYYITVRNENSKTSRRYLNQHLEVTQALNDLNGMANAYQFLAHHARFWGKIDEAIYYFTKATQVARQTQSTRHIAFFEAHLVLMRLKQGEFAYFIEQTLGLAEQLTSFGYLSNHPYLYMQVARAEALLGNYERSRTYLQQARSSSIYTFSRLEFHFVEVKIISAIGFKDFQSVRHSIIEALQLVTSVISSRLMLDFLTLVAFLYHHDHQYLKAIELLGMIFTHPLATTGWMEKWALLSELRQTLKQELGEEPYNTIWEHGGLLDLDEVIANIRAYVGLEPSIGTSIQPLVEPLTERELEVLGLLGEGYTNREIAGQLIVAIGTVKAHVHNICQKLAVNNRTQAVLHAKKLGML